MNSITNKVMCLCLSVYLHIHKNNQQHHKKIIKLNCDHVKTLKCNKAAAVIYACVGRQMYPQIFPLFSGRSWPLDHFYFISANAIFAYLGM